MIDAELFGHLYGKNKYRMRLYYPINLNCWDLIRRLTIEQTHDLSTKSSLNKHIKLPPIDQIFIDIELKKLGLPKCKSLLAFKRAWPKYEPNPYNLHVDWFGNDEINHVSIVFPVENCQGTAQFWYDGDYTLDKKIIGTDVTTTYYHVNVKDSLNLIGSVEISTTPMLVRTDLPHCAYAGNDYRLVCTMRLTENIDLDTAIEILSAIQ